jgi:hypothetical protein
MSKDCLVIMIGNARGGEKAWQKAYNNLLKPHYADLAICFGVSNQKISSLYKHSKYIWEIEEYHNWRNYYTINCHRSFWEKSLSLGRHSGLLGGIDNNAGSGAIIFAIRHFILKNYRAILEQYETIILTRSDHYYMYADDTNKDKNKIWIPEGEDWGGITDRHIEFNSRYITEVLDVLAFIDSEDGYNILKKENRSNPEGVLEAMFRYHNLPIARYKRNQFCVALKTDKTRWYFPGSFPTFFDKELLVKYKNEYVDCLNNYIKTV